ncbi:MAG: hypothetical protein IPJ65_11115 [Archangiaceae bacterium]|nr:hypothetical protein [Archangiaceae bacterium]
MAETNAPPAGLPNPWPARRKALKQMQVSCATSTDENLQELAEPIEQLLKGIDAVQARPVQEQQLLVLACDRLMFRVQAMGVLAYLKSLNQLRNTIAEKAAAATDPELKKKLQLSQAAHEEVLKHLSAAYEALRTGNKEAFEAAQRKLFAVQAPLAALYEKM